jgi:hypothetical protein
VTLGVLGPGLLVGPTVVAMKGGQLAAWVRSTRVAGTITMSASADGLLAGTIDLTSQPVEGLPPVPVDR